MVASLHTSFANSHSEQLGKSGETKNRVLQVLVKRLGSSKTFGANMIFMLNRASAADNSAFFLIALMSFA
jgi:hypothetical protein